MDRRCLCGGHFQSGFVSELRDGNHLLFMPMKQQIIVMKDGKHTVNCGLFKKKLLAKMQRIPSDLTVQLVKEGVFQKNVAHMVN